MASNTHCVVFLLCFSSSCVSYVVSFSVFFFVLCILCCQFLCVFRRLVYPMLPVSLHCPFFIIPSVFSNVYLLFLKLAQIHFILTDNMTYIVYRFTTFRQGPGWLNDLGSWIT